MTAHAKLTGRGTHHIAKHLGIPKMNMPVVRAIDDQLLIM